MRICAGRSKAMHGRWKIADPHLSRIGIVSFDIARGSSSLLTSLQDIHGQEELQLACESERGSEVSQAHEPSLRSESTAEKVRLRGKSDQGFLTYDTNRIGSRDDYTLCIGTSFA